ncbi:protein of unknown function [Candidatus Nitrosotalea okcheonensis]|uniref:Uncharacterized protein n=1 Tax=Candidatus Nitrosotalea okcheonensis TaxID=1903276 RepID=A0A2H1FG28_9ARCH|nr:protein of unknown function [Candidatus Nitrosotalea okcheonensis]
MSIKNTQVTQLEIRLTNLNSLKIYT